MKITEADKGQSQNIYEMRIFFFNPKKYIIYWIFRFLICKFVWDLQNNICGFNNCIKIWKSFFGIDYLFNDDFQKYYDLHFFGSRISDFGNILGLSLIGFRRKCSFTCVEKCRTPYV